MKDISIHIWQLEILIDCIFFFNVSSHETIKQDVKVKDQIN